MIPDHPLVVELRRELGPLTPKGGSQRRVLISPAAYVKASRKLDVKSRTQLARRLGYSE